ncbi:MAG: hypothetical protein QXD23_00955 [Candidatus Micrarchaeaceae archaeon]
MKLNKQNNKLFVYLSSDIINSLNLKENDEIEFLPYNNFSFLIAKKVDLAKLISGTNSQVTQKPQVTIERSENQSSLSFLSEEEILILKKLDQLRYNMRTVENVNKLIDQKSVPILQQLIKKKAILLLKTKDGKELYSITKYVYDKFLMRKNKNIFPTNPSMSQEQSLQKKNIPEFKNINSKFYFQKTAPKETEDMEIEQLDKNGFVVLQTEAEAAGISIKLEDSIRHGMVLGTRAFNKKFYIITRLFFEKNSTGIIKLLRQNPLNVSEIAKIQNLDEEATRGILYILSEAGDIRERRRDFFSIA